MPTYEITSPDGRTAIVEAPIGVSEQEAIAFSKENWAGWKNGGRYAMERDESAPEDEYKRLSFSEGATRAADLRKEVEAYDAKAREFMEETRGVLQPGKTRAQAFAEWMGDPTIVEKRQAAAAELAKLEIGSAGETVGATIGGVGGAAAGAALGALGGPFAPVTVPVGAALGGILGAAGGSYAGTRLYDIPAVEAAREITEAQAVEFAKSRAIETAIWDGAFVVLLGPGGKVLGKMAKGFRLKPALTAVAKESLSWDEAGKKQLEKTLQKRAALAPEGLGTQASDALGIAPVKTAGAERTAEQLGDLAQRTGGRIPTKGEMTGIVGAGEQFTRRQAPRPFFESDRALAAAAADIRDSALRELEERGALTGTNLGEALQLAQRNADRAVKNVTGPVFDRAEALMLKVNMRDAHGIVRGELERDAASGFSRLSDAERKYLNSLNEVWSENPFMSARGAIDFSSGIKNKAREIGVEGEPSTRMTKLVAALTKTSDAAFDKAAASTGNKALSEELTGARKLYRETFADLYGDTMYRAAKRNPEDVANLLTSKGSITEIREVRKAMARAASLAPDAKALDTAAELAKIDAGLVKGYLEQHTQSLTNLPAKLNDPKFRDTLRELLIGEGARNPMENRAVLRALDDTLAAIKLADPAMVPQPGRLGVPGMGGVGAGTAAAAVTGGGIQGAVGLVFATMGLSRLLGNMAASAMTTGNAGILNKTARAFKLTRAAGTNIAAAEQLRNLLAEIDVWAKEQGLSGITLPEGEQ